jgi:hypothetical protein
MVGQTGDEVMGKYISGLSSDRLMDANSGWDHYCAERWWSGAVSCIREEHTLYRHFTSLISRIVSSQNLTGTHENNWQIVSRSSGIFCKQSEISIVICSKRWRVLAKRDLFYSCFRRFPVPTLTRLALRCKSVKKFGNWERDTDFHVFLWGLAEIHTCHLKSISETVIGLIYSLIHFLSR